MATQLRCSAAGDFAEAWEDFGGVKPQVAHLANVSLVAFTNVEEAATKFREQPRQPRIMRTLAVTAAAPHSEALCGRKNMEIRRFPEEWRDGGLSLEAG